MRLADRSPCPQSILEQRAAEIEAVVLVVIGAVAAVLGEAAADARRADAPRILVDRLRLIDRQVVALQALVLEVVPRVAVRRVAALLEDHVQLHARRRVLRVGAARRHRHFLEHVEVVIGRRGAERAHVGDRHAVDRPRVVARARSLADVVGLLARLGAADVDAVDVDRRHGLHHDPRVARRRDILQLFERDVGRRRLAFRVDDRRRRRDVDGLHLTGYRHADVDWCRGARRHLHLRIVERAEAGERRLDGVRADRQIQEVRLALRVSDLRLARRSREIHGDAR